MDIIKFNLPIYYLKQKYTLNENIKTDLELKDISLNDESINLYDIIFNTKNRYSKINLDQWSEYYTDYKPFLKDSQKLYSDFNLKDEKKFDLNNFYDTWENFINETNFHEKYQYIDVKYFYYLNNSAGFLEFLSIYNLLSPVLSFIFPIIMLFIPFFIIKMKGLEITIPKYIEYLKMVITHNALGNIFVNFGKSNINQRMTMIFTLMFYIFQLYQNFLSCYRFYRNINKIHNEIFLLRDYLDFTNKRIENYLSYSKKLKTYQPFNDILKKKQIELQVLYDKIICIKPYRWNYKKVCDIGYIMKCYYNLYNDEECHNTIEYLNNFNGYLDNISEIKNNIKLNNINKCTFTKKHTSFKDSYYIALLNKNPVKNSYDLTKSIIITGPNAAGKTTILKTSLFNVILSQQIGFGLYKECKLNPYKYIHCYLNIPDTSGRDSLFQAESRRCKEIINKINNEKDRHFCVFDELFSGTNPTEATSSAFAYLEYLTNFKNVDFILTTHYLQLCEKIKKNDSVINCHMKIEKNNFTYILQKGISHVKGGIKILADLNFPEEIIHRASSIINTL